MVRRKTSPTAADAEPLLEKGSSRKRFSNAGDPDHATKKQRPEADEKTDYSRWRMRDDHSRHTWRYLEDDEAAKDWPQTHADKYFLGLPLVSASECTAPTCLFSPAND
jgi:lanosterol synthase